MIDSINWPEFGFACNGGGGCVIVERIAGAIVIRDSKNPTQPGLVFSKKEYAAFRRRVVDAPWRRIWPRLAAWLLRLISVVLRQFAA
jgi:Domain of unknown function (DUF397)